MVKMHPSRTLIVPILLLLVLGVASAEPCVIELKDAAKGIHLTVESCRDIGTFSLGGYYDGSWQRLTYFYPKPWKGTFMSVKIGNTVYSNSMESGGVFMDQYLIRGPEVYENSILTMWRLPDDMIVEQSFALVDKGVLLSVSVTNEGISGVNSGIRLHFDTMLGENDGAPIYIPGDGLKRTEAEYSGSGLTFRYWKAYDSIDAPSLIATGILNDQSYPTRLIVANWKKSMRSAWDYEADAQTSILGDSALILYYSLGDIEAGQKKTIVTRYINGEPILLESKGSFGIAEIVPDKISTIYCPGTEATLKVDVVSRKPGNAGQLMLEIMDEDGQTVYSRTETIDLMEADSVKDVPFTWQTPGNISSANFNAVAVLYDPYNNELDRKKVNILLDRGSCGTILVGDIGWVLLPLAILLLVILAAAAALFLVRQQAAAGEVEITKEKDAGSVKVTVINKKKTAICGCMIVDRIPEGAEVDIITSGVKRKDTELTFYAGDLAGGESAILEYRIKDAAFLPPAIIRWDFGENISRAKDQKQGGGY